MTRRRIVLVAVILVLLTSVAAALLCLRQSPLERAYYRLRLGMNKAEVEETMGRPPDGHAYGVPAYPRQVLHETSAPSPSTHWYSGPGWMHPCRRWVVGRHDVQVLFDDGQVVGIELIGPAPSPLFHRLRQWLGW